MVRVAVVGVGAHGEKHLAALRRIGEVELVAIADPDQAAARGLARRHDVPHVAADLPSLLAVPDIDAVILCTPTPLHADQALQCLDAGKHVQVEIPIATSVADAEALLERQQAAGLVCMAGHTRRFNAGHDHLHQRIVRGDLSIQQLDVQTFFLRRSNTNAKGEPRSWTDHLLWHHAAHTVDLFAYQAGPIVAAHAMQGPVDPRLGIAMDMSIQLKSAGGALCTLSLSFNNDGPFGTTFRYICDNGTWIARYDDLITGAGERVELAGDGVERQDREFVAAIRDRREPNGSIAQVMPCYRLLGALEAQLGS